jgi:DNA-binding winged helix-turn-helix (wHTH) protein
LNQISAGPAVRHLEPQIINLLVFLASRQGQVVSKDQIIDAVWDGRFIADATLTRSVADLRRALGDGRHHPEYIENDRQTWLSPRRDCLESHERDTGDR